jgi:hypothetical protein
VFRNHDKQDVHVVLTEHHVLIFDEKEYEKPLTSIALANVRQIHIFVGRVCVCFDFGFLAFVFVS